MTTQDIINNTKKNRSNMIDSYTPPVVNGKASNLSTLTEIRDLIESYLFNNSSGNYGIEILIEAYWQSIIYLRTTGSASTVLTSATTRTWTFASCPVYESDGTLKSPISRYISDNNLSLGATSIFDSLISQIGTVATDITLHDSGYVYASQALALAAQTAFIATVARTGTGLLGSRTKDIDNLSTSQVTLWKFIAGDGVSDTPDSWGAAGTTLLTTLNNLIGNLNAVKAYCDIINNYLTTYSTNSYLLNTAIFSSFDTNFSIYYNALQNHISSLTSYYITLNTLKDDLAANRAAINTQLTNLYSDLATYKTVQESRITAVSSGNTIMGLVTTPGTINYYRESILSMLVSFPDGIYSLMTIPPSQETTIETEIAKCEKILLSFGLTSDEFIPTPVMISTRWKNKLKTEVHLSWSSPLHPSSYKIYRKESSLVTDNTQWTEDYLLTTIDYTDPDLITEWTKTNYIDTAIPDNTKNYCYRIKSIDSYWSSNGVLCSDSESLQSDVWLSGTLNSRSISS